MDQPDVLQDVPVPLVYLTAATLATNPGIVTFPDGTPSDLSWGEATQNGCTHSFYFGSNSSLPGGDATALLGPKAWPVPHLQFVGSSRPIDIIDRNAAGATSFSSDGQVGMAMMVLFSVPNAPDAVFPLVKLVDGAGIVLQLLYDSSDEEIRCEYYDGTVLKSDNVHDSKWHWIIAECNMEVGGHAILVADNQRQDDVFTSGGFVPKEIPMTPGAVLIGDVPYAVDIAGVVLHDKQLKEVERAILRESLMAAFTRTYPGDLPCPSSGVAAWTLSKSHCCDFMRH